MELYLYTKLTPALSDLSTFDIMFGYQQHHASGILEHYTSQQGLQYKV